MKLRIIIAVAVALTASRSSSGANGQARFSTLYNFPEGSAAGLVVVNGTLYGSGWDGPCGNIFELQPPAAGGGSWTQSVLYTFASTGDACAPVGSPALGAKGRLYGVTAAGGANRAGALYELQPPASPGGTWTESVVYSFGAQPEHGLIGGPDGSFYVLYGSGGVLQLFPPAQPNVGWSGVELLSSSEQGRTWISVGPEGYLYGLTAFGGRAQRGSVDELLPPRAPGGTWTTKVIHSFACCGKAVNDPMGLTLGTDGTIYGTTYGSIPPMYYGAGGAFALTPPQSPGQDWTYTLLADFGAKHLNSPLVLNNGNLYGTLTTANMRNGAVFELQPPAAPGSAWTTTYLHHFTNGQQPYGLVVDKHGTIYGITGNLYPPNQPLTGTIFKIAPGSN